MTSTLSTVADDRSLERALVGDGRTLLGLFATGAVGFGAAIGIHGLVGYLDASHVGPAVGGALLFAIGMALSRPRRG